MLGTRCCGRIAEAPAEREGEGKGKKGKWEEREEEGGEEDIEREGDRKCRGKKDIGRYTYRGEKGEGGRGSFGERRRGETARKREKAKAAREEHLTPGLIFRFYRPEIQTLIVHLIRSLYCIIRARVRVSVRLHVFVV